MKNQISDRVRLLCRTALLCAVLCVCAVITFPIGAVPVTLGLFGVYLCGMLLPPRRALAAVLCYLALGCVGMPVFSSMQSGIGVLFSVTGGFLWSYPVMAWLASVGVRVTGGIHRRPLRAVLRMLFCLLGLLCCYTLGCAWFMISTGSSVRSALTVCVVPFVLMDVVKILLAVGIGENFQRKF
ncbi:MAG: biotin transporter BioY [Clostridia bacterium]|nr:biotin transporter BioY [Clostridia bacterium]